MKKYLLFILAFLCLSFPAQAAEGIDVNIRGNGTEITVSGTVFTSYDVKAKGNSKNETFFEETLQNQQSYQNKGISRILLFPSQCHQSTILVQHG